MRHERLTIARAKEILAPTAWEKPQHYAGFSPDGDYCILTQHRDSDAVSRSNWECALIELPCDVIPFGYRGDSYSDFMRRVGPDNFADRPIAYHWRASHCLVGWVEYLMVRADAPADVLTAAANIVDSLEGYPILNEDHFGELEFNEACEAWENLDIRGRIEVLEGTGVSIFAARRPDMPSDDCGTIMERLR